MTLLKPFKTFLNMQIALTENDSTCFCIRNTLSGSMNGGFSSSSYPLDKEMV